MLSSADRAFWDENGYVVVRDAVSRRKREAVVDAIWEFLEMDRDQPEDWYREANPMLPHVAPRQQNGVPGLVELYHHQSLWDIRQDERVYSVFRDILGTPRLWVSFDRANMNPPVRPGWDYKANFHWDLDTSIRPIPLEVQGVVYLTDTPAEKGALEVVPGFHRKLDRWAQTQPADRNLRIPDMTGLEPRAVAGRAGDLVIWHRALPHSNAKNVTSEPRLAAYVTMALAREDDRAEVENRTEMWRERLPPQRMQPPLHPVGLERARTTNPAELTNPRAEAGRGGIMGMKDKTDQGALWSTVASSRRDTHSSWTQPIYRSVFDRIAPARGSAYLDVGCGTGEGVASAIARGLTATGIDPSEAMIRGATEAVRDATFMTASAEKLPFPDGAFALATSINSIHFCPRPQRALAEIRRVLSPGGHVAVHCVGPREECAISEVFRELLALVPLDRKLEPQFIDPFRLAAVGVVDDMLEAADLTGIESYYIELPAHDPSMEAAIARFKNVGLIVAVTAVVGQARALEVLSGVLSRAVQSDGSVLLPNTFRVVIGRRG